MIYVRELVRITQRENDVAGLAVAIRLLGGVHLYKGDYDSALLCSKKAYELSLQLGDSILISSSLNNIGFTQYHFGNYASALQNLLKALALKYKVHNNYGLAQTMNNIGLVYGKLKDFERAREYFVRALTISDSLKDNNQKLYSSNNIGYTYLYEQSYGAAERYFNMSLETAQHVNNNNWLATTYCGLGQVRLRMGNVAEASRLLKISLSLRAAISDLNGISEIYYLLSQVNATQNLYDSAFIKLRYSQALAVKIGSKNRQLENFEWYKSLFVATHKIDSALHYQNLFSEMKVELFNESLARELADIHIRLLEEENAAVLSQRDAQLQKRFQINVILGIATLFSIAFGINFYYNYSRKKKLSHDLQNKNEEIVNQHEEILQQREALLISNQELERAKIHIDSQNELLQDLNRKLQATVELRTRELETVNQELKYTNLELDNFIYRSSHDIRGPLVRLTGICQVALLDVHDEKAKDYLNLILETAQHVNDLFDRLKAVSEINNLDVSKNRKDIHLPSLTMGVKEKLKKLSAFQAVLYIERIDADLTVHTNEFLIETIFFGLLENAIKFQKVEEIDKNFIKVKAWKKGDHLVIVFIDNGIGIKQSHADHLFQMFTEAARDKKSIGMGLYIVKHAVEKLNGTIQFSRSKSGYTRFKVELPILRQ